MKPKHIVLLSCLLFVGVVGWKVGEKLSADAVGMAVGVLFGIMAGIPAALLVLASNRQREMQAPSPMQAPPTRRIPTVIVLTGANPSRQCHQLTRQQWDDQFNDDVDEW